MNTNRTTTEIGTIQERLQKLALAKSKPFCYGCYQEAPSGKCETCGSDDLMRLLPGVGCEYTTDWIVRHLIEENLESLNLDEAFEESVRQCYPETTKIGWLEMNTVTALKDLDPVSWGLAQSEWVSEDEGERLIVSFDNGSTYYSTSDIEGYLDKTDCEEVA